MNYLLFWIKNKKIQRIFESPSVFNRQEIFRQMRFLIIDDIQVKCLVFLYTCMRPRYYHLFLRSHKSESNQKHDSYTNRLVITYPDKSDSFKDIGFSQIISVASDCVLNNERQFSGSSVFLISFTTGIRAI
jgi:hypothetical protein